MNIRECPECGAKFAPRSGSQVCCSAACKALRDKKLRVEQKRRYRERHGKRRTPTVAEGRESRADPVRATVPVCFDVLSKASRKPANTSPVRWRIELRRRAMARQFGAKNMAFLPNPDTI